MDKELDLEKMIDALFDITNLCHVANKIVYTILKQKENTYLKDVAIKLENVSLLLVCAEDDFKKELKK